MSKTRGAKAHPQGTRRQKAGPAGRGREDRRRMGERLGKIGKVAFRGGEDGLSGNQDGRLLDTDLGLVDGW